MLRLLAFSRHFLASHVPLQVQFVFEPNSIFISPFSHFMLQENFAYRGKPLLEILTTSSSELAGRVGFFDSFCRDNIGTPFWANHTPYQSALCAVPGPNSKPEFAELIRRFESVMFPAIYYLPVDDPVLIGLLNIGLRHIDNIVATHGLNAALQIQRTMPELVTKESFWSCLCGAPVSAHDVRPWRSNETEKAIMSVAADKWLPVLASLQFVADALVEIGETCAVSGVGSSGHVVKSFASVKLSQKSGRMSYRTFVTGSGDLHSGRPRSGSRSPPRQSFSTTSRYDSIRFYDLSTFDSMFEKQGVSVCEKKILESAKHTLQSVHTLSRVLLAKVLVYDLNSEFYGQLFIHHINLLEQTKQCVFRSLDTMKKVLKGSAGSNANLIIALSAAAHAVTLTLVDDAILNGGSSRTFSRTLALTLEAQLQNLQPLFVEWLQENVTDFVPGLFPSLFKSKHLEFLITEIIPMMKRDSAELVTLFEASYAKAQNHVPISSPYFLSRVVLARDSGDAAAAAFR